MSGRTPAEALANAGRSELEVAYDDQAKLHAENERLREINADLLETLKEMVETFHGYQGMQLTRAKEAISRAEGTPDTGADHG